MRNFIETLKDKAYLLTLLVILAAGAHLALGAQSADGAGQAQPTAGQAADESCSFISADVIEARVFRLVDDSGAERATISMEDDAPVFRMYNKDGAAALVITAAADGSVSIDLQGKRQMGYITIGLDGEAMPSVELRQRDQGSASLAVDEHWSRLSIDRAGGCAIDLLTTSDYSHMSLENDAAASQIQMSAGDIACIETDCMPRKDGMGNLTSSMFLSSSESGSLMSFSNGTPEGQGSVQIGCSNSIPALLLISIDSNRTWSQLMLSSSSGEPRISASGKEGKYSWPGDQPPIPGLTP